MAESNEYDGNVLLSTLWNQYGVIKCGDNSTVEFNFCSPLDPIENKRSYTGCVNTAMGQVIYCFLENGWLDYHLSLTDLDRYVSFGNDPRRAIVIDPAGQGAAGMLSFAEINDLCSVFVPAPADPEASDYTVKSEAAANFIAALNFACGVINRSVYSSLTGTAASPHAVLYDRCGFTSVMDSFSFSQAEQARWVTYKYENGKFTSTLTDEIFEVFTENLLDGRPVHLSIPGHAVVLDGYDSERDMFHVNFGWGDEGGGPGGAEGTAAHTKWYTRDEFKTLNVLGFQSELHGSYIETFTVNDGRFYGSGTFLRALEQANAMKGANVIGFSGAETADAACEISYPYRLKDEILIRDFNLTVAGELPEPGDDAQVTESAVNFLFTAENAADIRFENFCGGAVLQTSPGDSFDVFEFSSAVRTALFFNGAKLYSGKYRETITNEQLSQMLGSGDIDALVSNTEKAFVIAGSCGDDTIIFDQNSISVGDIDLGNGLNNLIITGGSRLFGNIVGDGSNHIFVDGSASVAGELEKESKLYFDLEKINSSAVFKITGKATDTLQNITVLSIDSTRAAAGEHILFSWESPEEVSLDGLRTEITGGGELSVKDNSIVLTVTGETPLIEPPEGWTSSVKQDGNFITFDWTAFADAAGYCFRYAADKEFLAGSGDKTTVNSMKQVLNNGLWYFQVRAFDENGVYSGWSPAVEFTVSNTAETVTDSYLANGSLTDRTIVSDFSVLSGGVLCNAEVSSGTLTLENGSVTTGFLSISENASVDALAGAAFVFDLGSVDAETDPAVIDNFAAVNGTLRFGISVSESQAADTYVLADRVSSWDHPLKINVRAGDTLWGTFDANHTEFVWNDKACRLVFSQEEQQLQFIIEDAVSTTAAEDGSAGLRWDAPVGATGYIVEISESENFESRMHFITVKNELNVVTPLSKSCFWRTMTVGYDEAFTPGGVIPSADVSAGARIYAGKDNVSNLFAAESSGVWERGYLARHATLTTGWAGRVNDITLKGKNRYQDIFNGSEAEDCSNILFLSDDSNGDAFFIDDAFTAFPDEEARSRFSGIDSIYAGAGDDIIDMTSSKYEPANEKIFIHGGDGDDVIWADSGSFLFGDRGDDSIVGSSGQDHISGGAGDDDLHGGGGTDFFLYGAPETWGYDDIRQLEDGSVKIVFLGDKDFLKNNGISFEYDSETNSSIFRHESGSGIVIHDRKLDLAADVLFCHNYAGFDDAFAVGGFDAFSSGKVFEDIDNGTLA